MTHSCGVTMQQSYELLIQDKGNDNRENTQNRQHYGVTDHEFVVFSYQR